MISLAARKARLWVRGVCLPPAIHDLRLLLPGDRLPATVDQPLHRLELDLVGHLAALRDPVAEVEVGNVEPAAKLDLPQDVVGAEAGAADVGLEEGVDRGQAVLQLVHDGNHAQRAVLAELDQPRLYVALEKEMAVLLAAVLIHAAAGMAARLVAKVQRVVLGAVLERQHFGFERAVLLERAALDAGRLERLDLDA